MKISVVTPVYNAEKTIEKTIKSVINQGQNAELEYILIDGGSTDRTLEAINRYRDKINLIISEKDRGVYDAMNKGISYATGDIIGIINSDDWYNDGALVAVEEAFSRDSQVDLIYSPVDTYFNGEYLIRFIPGNLHRLPFKFTLNHPSCFAKKTVYDQIGSYNLTYTIAADYDFILRAYAAQFRFMYLDFPLASYSLNGLSGKPFAKFKQIYQSWLVGSNYAKANAPEVQLKRQLFYLNWLLKEILVFPIKHTIPPHEARKLKILFRELLGGRLPSDQDGAW